MVTGSTQQIYFQLGMQGLPVRVCPHSRIFAVHLIFDSNYRPLPRWIEETLLP